MKLVNITSPRPTRRTPAVARAAALRLMPAVLKWSVSSGGVDDDEEREEITKQLTKLLDWRTNDDGYQLAKELDHDGWSADSELVEILDDASMICRSELEKLEKAWIEEQAISEPPVDIKVRDVNNTSRGVGVIVRHYPGGKSSVAYEHLGHVKSGVGTHGYILNWEDLETID